MSAFAMIAGKLVGEVRNRPTSTGGTVAFFRLKVVNGNAREFWDVATFDEECRAALADLPDGFPICATGEFSVEPWEKGDKRGFNLKLTASTITRLSGKKRPTRAIKPRETGRDVARRSWAAPDSLKDTRRD